MPSVSYHTDVFTGSSEHGSLNMLDVTLDYYIPMFMTRDSPVFKKKKLLYMLFLNIEEWILYTVYINLLIIKWAYEKLLKIHIKV